MKFNKKTLPLIFSNKSLCSFQPISPTFCSNVCNKFINIGIETTKISTVWKLNKQDILEFLQVFQFFSTSKDNSMEVYLSVSKFWNFFIPLSCGLVFYMLVRIFWVVFTFAKIIYNRWTFFHEFSGRYVKWLMIVNVQENLILKIKLTMSEY